MVVKVLRDHNSSHLDKPITAREFKRILKEIVAAMVGFGVIVCFALLIALSAQRETAKQADAIQRSRYQSQLDSCRATNMRNTKTKLKLAELSSTQPARRGESTAQQDMRTTGVIALIDALAPPTADCAAFARSRVATP